MDTKIKASFWDDDAVGRLAEQADHRAMLALIWIMTARVNCAGWVDFSLRAFRFQTGCDELDIARACDALGMGIISRPKGFWLRNYIRHQIGTGSALAANTMAGAVRKALQFTPPEIVKEIMVQYPELVDFHHETKPRVKPSPSDGDGKSIPSTREEKSREEQRRAREKFGFPPAWSEARTAAVEEFIAFRQQIRKPMKPASFPAWVKKFSAVDDATLIATLQESIANGWQGVFPERLTLPKANGEMQKKEKGAGKTWAGRMDARDQAHEDEMATLRRVPIVDAAPDWDWESLLMEIYGVKLPWPDVQFDVRADLEREHAKRIQEREAES